MWWKVPWKKFFFLVPLEFVSHATLPFFTLMSNKNWIFYFSMCFQKFVGSSFSKREEWRQSRTWMSLLLLRKFLSFSINFVKKEILDKRQKPKSSKESILKSSNLSDRGNYFPLYENFFSSEDSAFHSISSIDVSFALPWKMYVDDDDDNVWMKNEDNEIVEIWREKIKKEIRFLIRHTKCPWKRIK